MRMTRCGHTATSNIFEQHPASAPAVRRRLKQRSLFVRRLLLRLSLTQQHRRLRLQWCQEWSVWKIQWNNVAFFDESRFCVQHHDGRICVRRYHGERLETPCMMQRQTGPEPVMVWGAIGLTYRSHLVHITGTLDSQRYIN